MCFAKRRHPQCPAVLIQELLLATAASGEGIQTWRAVLQLQPDESFVCINAISPAW
jgi:hypothetical protein